MTRLLACWICVLLIVTGGASAQDRYPSRVVRLVVPFAVGGSTDVLARALAQQLGERIGQPVVVENRPGAGGTVGTEYVAKQPPDGYTLLLGTVSTHSVAVSLYDKLGYDPVRDYAPITEIATIPNLVVVNADVTKVHTLAEFIALAKRQPGTLSYASNGQGTSNHLASELLKTAAGINLIHVPYKGSGPALNDLVGGHVSMYFSSMPPAIQLVKDGRLRALGVTGLARSPIFPELPTISESALPGFEAVLHYGIIAPAGTPKSAVMKLNAALRQAVMSNELKQKLAADGTEPLASTPEEYATDIDKEETKWSAIVKKSGAKAE